MQLKAASDALEESKALEAKTSSEAQLVHANVTELNSHLEKFGQEKEELLEKISTLESSLEELRKKEDDSKSTNGQNAKQGNKAIALQQKIDKINQERQNFERNSSKKLSKLQDQNKEAEKRILEKEGLIKKLSVELEEIKANNTASKIETSHSSDQYEDLQRNYDDLQARYDSCQSELTDEKEKLQQSLAQLGEIEKLRKEHHDLQEQYNCCQVELSETKANLQQSETQRFENERLQKEYEGLQARYDNCLAELSDVKEKLNQTEQQLRDAGELEAKITDLTKIIDHLKASMETEKQAVESEREKNAMDIKEKLDEIAKLELEKLSLLSEKEEGTERHNLLTTEREKASALLEKVTQERDAILAWKTGQEAVSQQQQNAHASATKELTAKIEELSSLVEKQQNAELVALESVKVSESKISALEETIKTQEKKGKEIEESLIFAKETIHQRDSHISKLEEKIESITKDMNASTQRATKLEKDKANLTEEINIYKGQLSELTDQLIAAQQSAKEAESSVNEKLEKQRQEHQNDIDGVKEQLAETIKKESQNNTTLLELKQQLKLAQEELATARAVSGKLQKDLDEQVSALKKSEEETNTLRAALAEAKDVSAKQISELQQRSTDAEKVTEEKQLKISELEKLLSDLEIKKQTESDQLQNNLDEAQRKLENLGQVLDNAKKEIEDRSASIESLQQDLESASLRNKDLEENVFKLSSDWKNDKDHWNSLESELVGGSRNEIGLLVSEMTNTDASSHCRNVSRR